MFHDISSTVRGGFPVPGVDWFPASIWRPVPRFGGVYSCYPVFSHPGVGLLPLLALLKFSVSLIFMHLLPSIELFVFYGFQRTFLSLEKHDPLEKCGFEVDMIGG